MNILAIFLTLFISLTPSSNFKCDNELLEATIRNNLNGDFAVTNDLEKIDEGSFVVLNWKDTSLMLPISFNKNEISFTDKKWLWSYRDNVRGLHIDAPRFAELMPNGKIIDYECEIA
tara:strand:- start:364 stop:714 length:351 start_codon:yes stop_codon:yes gene_type:complete